MIDLDWAEKIDKDAYYLGGEIPIYTDRSYQQHFVNIGSLNSKSFQANEGVTISNSFDVLDLTLYTDTKPVVIKGDFKVEHPLDHLTIASSKGIVLDNVHFYNINKVTLIGATINKDKNQSLYLEVKGQVIVNGVTVINLDAIGSGIYFGKVIKALEHINIENKAISTDFNQVDLLSNSLTLLSSISEPHTLKLSGKFQVAEGITIDYLYSGTVFVSKDSEIYSKNLLFSMKQESSPISIFIQDKAKIIVQTFSVNAVSIENAGEIICETTLDVKGGNINNQGKIFSNQNIDFNCNSFTNYGDISSDSSLTIATENNITNNGQLLSYGDITLKGNNLYNHNIIYSEGWLKLYFDNSIENLNSKIIGKGLQITNRANGKVQYILNSSGEIEIADYLGSRINAHHLENKITHIEIKINEKIGDVVSGGHSHCSQYIFIHYWQEPYHSPISLIRIQGEIFFNIDKISNIASSIYINKAHFEEATQPYEIKSYVMQRWADVITHSAFACRYKSSNGRWYEWDDAYWLIGGHRTIIADLLEVGGGRRSTSFAYIVSCESSKYCLNIAGQFAEIHATQELQERYQRIIWGSLYNNLGRYQIFQKIVELIDRTNWPKAHRCLADQLAHDDVFEKYYDKMWNWGHTDMQVIEALHSTFEVKEATGNINNFKMFSTAPEGTQVQTAMEGRSLTLPKVKSSPLHALDIKISQIHQELAQVGNTVILFSYNDNSGRVITIDFLQMMLKTAKHLNPNMYNFDQLKNFYTNTLPALPDLSDAVHQPVYRELLVLNKGLPAPVMGSSYFLHQLSFKDSDIVYSYGNPAAELEIYKQAVFNALGRAYIYRNFADHSVEFEHLLSNAVTLKNKHGLLIGQELSNSIIQDLKEPVLWPVWSVIAGKKILGLRLYVNEDIVRDAYFGSTLSIGKADLSISNGIFNAGLLDVLVSGVIKTSNILNLGTIKSGNNGLLLEVKNFISQAITAQLVSYSNNFSYKQDITLNNPKIKSSGDITIEAYENIILHGGEYHGKNIRLEAEDKIIIVPVKLYRELEAHYLNG
jgi:adhesin HecA-like repeat protein